MSTIDIARGDPLPQTCLSCGSHNTQSTPFCAFCGKPLINDADATSTGADTPTFDRPPSSRPSSRPASRPGRFVPGDMVAGRYRIIALLGKGGMGEVYRADDLNLGQEVALKFLPEAATNEESLERFRTEVRIARQISHPNVCRVYDIGEAQGQIYLSMEYIDGEDLASLLRRIGRLPSDKAVEIARKVCAGLAAAHNKGVLHRDLKPANIMLDGRGEALVTDFGLAGLAAEITDVASGTPAYMAPEQLAGKEVTMKSDIYSLGLVLYELFTGRRAFDGRTLEEITRVRRDRLNLSRPSTLVKDIDPAIERAIFRCLEEDPSARPSSALEVSAALPGGDPLAAALAAGETPSPQLVAAAGDRTGVPVKLAASLFGGVIIGLVLVFAFALKNSAFQNMDLPYPPDVLSQKARDALHALGYTAQPFDAAESFTADSDLYEYLDDPSKAKSLHWNDILNGRPGLLQYWRRESPANLVAADPKDSNLTPGIVSLDDPPPVKSGMLQIKLDQQGRLTNFEEIPPQHDERPVASPPVDWSVAFSLAGLDIKQFKPAEPQWNPLGTNDARAAWVGTWPGTSQPLRVEAASYRGKPTYFSLIGDWAKPDRQASSQQSSSEDTSTAVIAIFGATVLFTGVFIAYRNFRLGKVDVQGTLRLGIVEFASLMVLWLCRAHFVLSVGSFGMFILALAGSLFLSAFLCTLYLALEPYIRRHWPHAIISWTRLLTGKIRDPLVGRDVMIGLLLGIFWSLAFELMFMAKHRLGGAPAFGSTDYLQGTRSVLGVWLANLTGSIQGTLAFFFLLFLLRVLLRKPWLAAAGFVAFWTGLRLIGSHHLALDATTYIFIYGIAAFVVVRFGFLCLAVGIFIVDLLLNLPMTSHISAWYFSGTLFALLSVLALAGWGFYVALAGQKLLKERLFE
jgi:serine/threonine protein kinase